MKNKIIYLLFFLPVFISCNSYTEQDNSSDWKKGKTVIAADENLRPILLQFKKIFENEYPEATIDFKFEANDSIINHFVNGDYTSGIISRSLVAGEINNSGIAHHAKIKQRVFAFSGIAFVANTNFIDSIIELNKISEYLQDNRYEIIFDNATSGMTRYLMQFLNINSTVIKKAKSTGSYDEVIQYVKLKNNAIGCIPFSAISDIDNKKAQTELKSVRLLDIKWKDTIYSISQQSIANGNYPLWQPLNFILSTNHEPVTEAFMNFLQKSKAAKIVLKAGLVPIQMPNREYIITDSLALSN